MSDVLHDVHMEMVTYLENILHRRNVLQHGGGNYAIRDMGYLKCFHGTLELAWEHIHCGSDHARGVDIMEYMK